VDDDLLPVEGRIQVRDDPNGPAVLAVDPEVLGRRAVLSPYAERALVELGLGRLVDRS
jgi:hypothetical protein